MRKITIISVLALVLFTLGVHLSYAQTVYVTDDFEITMRSGASIQHKVIAMPVSGTPLTVIKEEGDWLLVQNPSQLEGWVLKRYVSAETPKKVVIERLQKRYDDVVKTTKTATEKAGTLERENKELRLELARDQEELKRVNQVYNKLVSESKDFLNLKEKFDANGESLRNATSELEQLRKENSELRSNENIRWFLIGAAVVALSWLIGFIMGKIRKREKGSALYR